MATITSKDSKRIFQLTLAIQKAINSVETPVKEKHVRSTIIGTFQEQSAVTFWMVALRLPLQDNRIVAWKFCHVTHKVLREGHPASLDDSQRHIGMIENLGKLWVHLREGYGRLVHLYCNLLVCKLKFHARNPRFPGHMQLSDEELDAIAENDVNNYFQLCVELFDYMDDLLNLQAAVFESLGNARANSMTASGQCRLAALIPCAQDSSQIYDCNVRLLFRLHAALPADTLSGHRERFRQQFKKLSQFYKHASSLQYYRNLLTLPILPPNPPNFLLQSDFGTYVTPVVSIPEQPPDEVDTVGSLIDTSDTISQSTTPDNFDIMDTRTTPSPQPDPVVERDRLIDHLQNELKRMRLEVSQMVQERNTMVNSMREHCARMETQLRETKTELEEEKQKAEMLSIQTPEIKQKLTQTEEKAKVTDEKFQKLKGAYTQLREEHIALIRQKAEVDKAAAGLRAAAAQHETAKMALQQQLNDKLKDVELLQQSASSSEEIEAYKSEISSLRAELEQSRQKEAELETLRGAMEALQIEHKATEVEQEEKIQTVTNGLKEVMESLEKLKQEKEEKENELTRVKEELVILREKSGNEYKKVVEQKEAALKEVAELKEQFQQEKEEQIHYIKNLQMELESVQSKLKDNEITFAIQCQKLKEELSAKSQALDSDISNKDTEIRQALDKLEALQTELDSTKSSYIENLQSKDYEINSLQDKIKELSQNVDTNISKIKHIEAEKNDVIVQLNKVTDEKISIEHKMSEKDVEISNLELKIKQLIDIESSQCTALVEVETKKSLEINQLNAIIEERNRDISNLQSVLHNATQLSEKQNNETKSLAKTISELEMQIKEKDEELEKLNTKYNEVSLVLEQHKVQFQAQQKEYEYKVALLNEKLQTVTDCKDEIIQNLNKLMAEKDEQVIALNVEVNKLSTDVSTLKEELTEAHAELEIGKNEFLTLREEHDLIVQRNEQNITLKNQELRNLNEEVAKLSKEKTELITEKHTLSTEYALEKQVFENKIKELEVAYNKRNSDYEIIQKEREEIINKMSNEIRELKEAYEQMEHVNKSEIQSLNDKLNEQETNFKEEICKKDEEITQAHISVEELKAQYNELQQLKEKEKEDINGVLAENVNQIKILEARLAHTDGERLTSECELQDLLQHNSLLETDLAAVKKQLEQTQKELEKQKSSTVTCAGEAALEITNEAIAALERGSPQDTNTATAELAAQAFEQLTKHAQVKGNEEAVARSAIFAAHNTASLSAYVNEVCNISTDMVLSDKLNSECRTMLTATKQCLESLKSGLVQTTACVEARGHVKSLAQAAAATDRLNSGARCVDDELADMDHAIEEAASRIEEMLAASRAGDSGVKLEVNGKILDACTTLMSAVKILVQDARKLQNELGDPKTRQKMYRRNPQWSEGLISAAKAVVFAAKLLVSSADEAVGAAGRVEGVSAAAHEVAGSTAQLVAASRARAPPSSPALARLTGASRSVAAATGALVAAVRAASALHRDTEALDTTALTLTATRRLEMESKVRSLELESALEAERAKLAALRKRHYQLAQMEENGTMTNGKE